MAWSDEGQGGHVAGDVSRGAGHAAGRRARAAGPRCRACGPAGAYSTVVGAAVIGCALVRDAPPAVSVAVAVMRAV